MIVRGRLWLNYTHKCWECLESTGAEYQMCPAPTQQMFFPPNMNASEAICASVSQPFDALVGRFRPSRLSKSRMLKPFRSPKGSIQLHKLDNKMRSADLLSQFIVKVIDWRPAQTQTNYSGLMSRHLEFNDWKLSLICQVVSLLV